MAKIGIGMSREERRSRPKDYRKTLRGLLRYIAMVWPLLLPALVLVFVSNIISLWGPRFSGRSIDALGLGPGQADIPEAVKFAFFMLGAYLISAVLEYILRRLMIKASQSTMRRMRQDTFNKIVELPLAYIDTHQAGDLVSRISYDLDVVNQSLSNDIIQITASLLTVIGSLIMMLQISPLLSLLFLGMLPVTVIFTYYRIKKTRPLFRKRSRKLGELNGFTEEILSGQKTIRAYNKADFFSEAFDEVNTEASDAYFQADYQAAFNGPSVTLISNLSIALLSLLGAMLYLKGQLSIGTLSAFVLYSRHFSGPIMQIANLYAELQSALSAAERVFDLMAQPSEPEDKPDAVEIRDVKGVVEFENLSFSYLPGVPVIKDLNLKADAGSLTAIVGPTGAGKTTIINLLMRFYEPQKGRILLDGIDISDITRRSLRRSFAMVLQDSWLFKGTIRDNIAYGRPEASLEEIKRAAKAAHIHDFIESQPDGYDSMLTDGASNLSQGQRQLMSIARAMLLDSPLLILDEATSNVDSRTEMAIQDAMNQLIAGRTSFVIAHRLSTIQNADHILMLVDGEICEQGTHEEMLARGGPYADLYYAQFA